MKALGYLLMIVGGLWLLGVLGMDLAAARAGGGTWATALIHTAWAGLLPALAGIGLGGWLAAGKQSREAEELAFQREQQLLQRIHKEGTVRFDTLALEMLLNREEIHRLLMALGDKNLVSGVIDWREKRFLSSEAMEKKLTHGECPLCGSLTAAESPRKAVCTRCEAILFYPEAGKRTRG